MENCTNLKFVVTADQNSPYSQIPDWAKEAQMVYVSPMNIYNRLPVKQAALDGSSTDMQVRSTVDEVVSFWEPGLLNMEANEANHKYAAKICMERGFILSLQSHLYVGIA
jgi:hypothetical protein